MPDAEQPSEFQRSLAATHACTDRLLASLEEENLALRSNDPVHLEQATADKLAVIREFEGHNNDHDRFLSGLGMPPGQEGTERYLASLSADAAEHTQWARLRSLIHRCRQQNETNGAIITLSQRQIQQAVALLKGAPPPSPLYDRSGGELPESHTSTLLKA